MMATALQFSELITTKLTLAVQLHDAYTGRPSLLGDVSVSVPDLEIAERKQTESTFIFRKLPAGLHLVEVRSLEFPAKYLPVDLSITLPLPDPLWPAFPDRSVANSNLMFDDPLQPALFRAQYLRAGLVPTVSYPFPGDATLVRGTVTESAGPLADAAIFLDGDQRYTTATDGDYVVALTRYQPSVVLTFQRAGFQDSAVAVNVLPQQTVFANVLMTV